MVNASSANFCMTILSTAMTTSTKYGHSEEDTIKSSEMQVAAAGDDIVDDDEILCPLFMEGLPTDFASNPQLAAIANLLEDNEDEDDSNRKIIKQQAPHQAGKAGGGKIRSKSRYQRQTSPYPKPPQSNNKPKHQATMGEAQLFLNLWKL
jgi:hypothetical protein